MVTESATQEIIVYAKLSQKATVRYSIFTTDWGLRYQRIQNSALQDSKSYGREASPNWNMLWRAGLDMLLIQYNAIRTLSVIRWNSKDTQSTFVKGLTWWMRELQLNFRILTVYNSTAWKFDVFKSYAQRQCIWWVLSHKNLLNRVKIGYQEILRE